MSVLCFAYVYEPGLEHFIVETILKAAPGCSVAMVGPSMIVQHMAFDGKIPVCKGKCECAALPIIYFIIRRK